jgi:endonuclease/exonuclease/phosphatase family metal-dependent hydrolase
MKLVTWNIQWGRGADGRVDLHRIARHARRFADFDVLCLQEVSAGYPELPGCDGSDQFAALAALFPEFTAVEGPAVDAPKKGGRRRFGNMLLSRLPVYQVFRHLLPWPSEPGTKSMQRGVVEATVETSFGLVRVMTTHLEYYSRTQREAQIDRLRELHRQAVAHARAPALSAADRGPFDNLRRGASAVLAGDFNFRPGAPEHARLTAPIDEVTPAWLDAWPLAHPGVPHAPTLGVHDKGQWPGDAFTSDFVFVSEDLAPRVAGLEADLLSDASDHQPLLIELR